MTNNNNTEIKNIAKALVKFQGMMVNPPKRKTATIKSERGTYSYKFADLADICDTLRKPLAECGLGYIQNVVTTDTEIGIETILIHESGGMFTYSPVMMPKEKNPQKIGALLTYCRRYSLQIATGCVAEEDTDCRQETATPEPTKEEKPAPVVEKPEQKRNLDAFTALAETNAKHDDRVKNLRRFMAICKDKHITSEGDIHAIIFRHTNGHTQRRRDLSAQQLLTLNTLLENCSVSEISRIIDSVREKMAATA